MWFGAVFCMCVCVCSCLNLVKLVSAVGIKEVVSCAVRGRGGNVGRNGDLEAPGCTACEGFVSHRKRGILI